METNLKIRVDDLLFLAKLYLTNEAKILIKDENERKTFVEDVLNLIYKNGEIIGEISEFQSFKNWLYDLFKGHFEYKRILKEKGKNEK